MTHPKPNPSPLEIKLDPILIYILLCFPENSKHQTFFKQQHNHPLPVADEPLLGLHVGVACLPVLRGGNRVLKSLLMG